MSVQVGSQTYISANLSIEVHNCIVDVSFPYLEVKYFAKAGEEFPIIDTELKSTSNLCELWMSATTLKYSLLSETKGVELSEDGIFKVDSYSRTGIPKTA